MLTLLFMVFVVLCDDDAGYVTQSVIYFQFQKRFKHESESKLKNYFTLIFF